MGSTKDPTPAQDAPTKAAPTISSTKNLTLSERKARAQAANAAFKNGLTRVLLLLRSAQPLALLLRRLLSRKDFVHFLTPSPKRVRRRGLSPSSKRSPTISMSSKSVIKLLNSEAPQSILCVSHAVYPRGYYPPDAGSGSPMFLEHLKAPRGLNHGRISRGAYERTLVQDKPLFVDDIEAVRCVLLAPHRIPLKEFTSLRKKPEDRGGLFPPENTTIQPQAEDLFWRWVSLKNFTVQELKELREDRLLSYVLDQRDLRIEFAHFIAKRQLHSVMEGLRQQSKFSAQDERGYGSVNPGTVHRKAAKKPRTTYSPAVAGPRSQQPSGGQPGAGLPAPTSSVARRYPGGPTRVRIEDAHDKIASDVLD
ncbi:LOW QUALITY PROTEIN: Hypothetical protein PHPALM_1092 [Phytophthora palmivora]|uniref:ATP-binding cassette (ABC) Superfamily n=1 Tax=Phytophthora palmivora TaxID=4796 RepID=A0A2P4YT88_9STRA|nr:LOW QUALITY PROTEIN: Hypothetical protein PHPALM_1092 [Phytophthora palmivora]